MRPVGFATPPLTSATAPPVGMPRATHPVPGDTVAPPVDEAPLPMPAPSAPPAPADRAVAAEPPLPQGVRVREAFDHLASAPLAEGVDRSRVVHEARVAVADPGSAISQGTHPHMCVATTLEYRLARQDPARFLAILEGLLSPSGAAPDGLARAEDSVIDDGTNRSTVDRVFQDALFARTAYPGMRYDAIHHAWQGPNGGPAEGLQPRQARDLLEETSQEVAWETVRGSEARGFVGPVLRNALADGVTLPVAMYALGGGAHEILVEEMQGDTVVYRDPEAARAHAFEGAMALDATRGRYAIPLEDFEDQVASMAIPARYLPPELAPPGAMYF